MYGLDLQELAHIKEQEFMHAAVMARARREARRVAVRAARTQRQALTGHASLLLSSIVRLAGRDHRSLPAGERSAADTAACSEQAA